MALCQVLYVVYEQCCTDSLNRLSVTATTKIRKYKANYVLQYTFFNFFESPFIFKL